MLLYAGYVKGSPALAWLPIDLTVIAAALVLVLMIEAILTVPHVLGRAAGWTVSLFASFSPALFWTSANPYASEKPIRLFFITGLAMLGAVVLIRSRRRAWWLVAWFAVSGIGILILARFAPSLDTLGRASIEGSNTIAFGRVAGAAILAVVALIYIGRIRLFVGVPIVLALVGSAFASGSRGPLLAVLVAAVVASIANGRGRRGLVRGAIVGVMITVVGLWFFSRTNAVAANRIDQLFASDRGDSVQVRLTLLSEFAHSVWTTPWGTGWGDATENVPTYGEAGYKVYPHNIVLEIFSDAGIFAGVLVVVALVVGILALWCRATDPLAMTLLALFVYWFVNASVSGDVNDNRATFVLLGLALSSPVVFRVIDPPGYGSGRMSPSSGAEYGSRFSYGARSSPESRRAKTE